MRIPTRYYGILWGSKEDDEKDPLVAVLPPPVPLWEVWRRGNDIVFIPIVLLAYFDSYAPGGGTHRVGGYTPLSKQPSAKYLTEGGFNPDGFSEWHPFLVKHYRPDEKHATLLGYSQNTNEDAWGEALEESIGKHAEKEATKEKRRQYQRDYNAKRKAAAAERIVNGG